jgi:hypothetical protein
MSLRAIGYCALMIVVTSSMPANARPYASVRHVAAAPNNMISCGDRGCLSGVAPRMVVRSAAPRVRISPRQYARGYDQRDGYGQRDSYDQRNSYGQRDNYGQRDGYGQRDSYGERDMRADVPARMHGSRMLGAAAPRRVARLASPTWQRPGIANGEHLWQPSAVTHTASRAPEIENGDRMRQPSAISHTASRAGAGVVTIETATNPITVAASVAGPMRDLIGDLVAHGFRGHVDCLASGHMPGSLHHSGEACDFAQLSRNAVAPGAGIMYHASDIIAAHGLRDGCSFHDCGHVDSGRMAGRMSNAYARWTGPVRHPASSAGQASAGRHRLNRVAYRGG